MKLVLKDRRLFFVFNEDTPLTEKLLKLLPGTVRRIGDIAFHTKHGWFVTDQMGRIIKEGFETYQAAKDWEQRWAERQLERFITT